MQLVKTPIKILFKYADFTNVFLLDLVIKLSGNTNINEYNIKLVDGKQPPYGPIYMLSSIKLETLKTFIETYLKTGFNKIFKSPANAFILSDKKPDGNFCLYVNYQGLNNHIIKNQ